MPSTRGDIPALLYHSIANTINQANIEAVNDSISVTIAENIYGEHNEPAEVFPVTTFDELDSKEEKDFTLASDDTKIGDLVAFRRAEGMEKSLTRAYLLNKYTWSSADDGMVRRYTFPHSLLRLPFIAQKARYYSYLRTGFKFLFQVNGTPYHYGLMKVRWIPAYLMFDSIRDQFATIQSMHNAPGIDIIPTGSRTYEFTVPYELAYQNVNLKRLSSYTSVIGTLQVWIVNPLVSIGETATSITVAIYAAMDDPILSTPVGESINFEILPAPTDVSIPHIFDKPIPSSHSYDAQSGVLTACDGHRPVNAKERGKSRKPRGGSSTPVLIRAPQYATSREPETGYAVTLDPENSIPEIKSLGGSSDEDRISKITSTESFLGRVSFNQSVAETIPVVGVRLTPLTRRREQVTYETVQYDVTGTSFMSYVGNLFQFYRGSMRVRFEFIYSTFQTQRFRIVYVPEFYSKADNSNFFDTCLSKIVTVNGYTSVDVCVPYVSSRYAIDLKRNQAIGWLYLVPESKLVSSVSALTTSVYVNTYMATGEDAEFFVLRNRLTYNGTVFPSSDETLSLLQVQEQSKDFDDIGSSGMLGKHVAGETFGSVSDIIQRSVYRAFGSPVVRVCPSLNYLTPSTGFDLQRDPFFMYFGLIYRFRSGGIRVTVPHVSAFDVYAAVETDYNWTADTNRAIVDVSKAGATDPSTLLTRSSRAGSLYVGNSTTMPISFKAPYYNKLPYVYNNIDFADIVPVEPPTVIISSGTNLEGIMIAAASDFKFYKLFTPPTLFVPTPIPPP